MNSTLDLVASLDTAASVDPVIVSADPVIRRSSARAFTVEPAALSDFMVVDTASRRFGLENIPGQTFVPAFSLHSEFQLPGSGTTPAWVIDVYGSSPENFEFAGRKAEGTKAAPTALSDDSDMWEFSARGYDGTSFSGQQAAILFEAAGAWSGISRGTRQVYKNTEQGSTALVEVLVLGDDGCLVVTGQTNGLIGAVAGEFLRVEGGSRLNGNIDLPGNFEMKPTVDNNWSLGTGALRLALVRAVTITAGDLTFENGWRFTEDYEDDGMALKDRRGREMFAIRQSGLYIMGKRVTNLSFERASGMELVA